MRQTMKFDNGRNSQVLSLADTLRDCHACLPARADIRGALYELESIVTKIHPLPSAHAKAVLLLWHELARHLLHRCGHCRRDCRGWKPELKCCDVIAR